MCLFALDLLFFDNIITLIEYVIMPSVACSKSVKIGGSIHNEEAYSTIAGCCYGCQHRTPGNGGRHSWS
jgi:hypothetical protein